MKAPDRLPIEPLRQLITEAIGQSDLVVAASTGSGKSTCLPRWLSESGRVLVVEPRRVACTALAAFVAEQAGTDLGDGVGYAIRFDNCYRDSSRVVFVTPGVALRWLAEDGLQAFDILMLDEFHERRWDTDLLLAILKKRGSHRLVLTSATFNANALAGYLDAQVFEADGRNFPVDVRYRAKEPHHMPDARGIEQRVAEAVKASFDEHSGDTLVFLPGRKEIQQCASALKKSLLKSADAEVLVLHASVSRDEQKRALEPGSARRIILATNVAETSLTIPAVTLVVDSGLERRTHQRNGRTVLGLHSISRASAEQRRGRAGRVAPGICIRLWGEHAPLEAVTPPEVQREDLTDMVLAAASAQEQIDRLQFADRLPEKSLNLAISQLNTMGALDTEGQITPLGEALFPLPIDTFFAHLIMAMPDPSLKGAMADLAASLSVRRWIRLPSDEHARQQLAEWQPVGCDATTLVAALRNHSSDNQPAGLITDTAARSEARTLAKQIRHGLGLPAMPDTLDFNRDDWLAAVIAARPDIAFVRRAKRPDAMGNGWREVKVGDQTRLPDSQEAAVVFDDYSLPGRGTRQTLTIATCLAPVPFSALARAGLGEIVQGNVAQDDEGLSVIHQRIYADRIIAEEVQSPQGDALRKAVVALMRRNRLFKGVARRIDQDIAAFALYQALQTAAGTATSDRDIADPDSWLLDQLDMLGVEDESDLELIDGDDLVFDGIPEWERKAFDEKYPLEIRMSDLRMKVNYYAGRRLIELEHQEGKRKDAPKRWELPAWSGWKIRYRKASRVIDIR